MTIQIAAFLLTILALTYVAYDLAVKPLLKGKRP